MDAKTPSESKVASFEEALLSGDSTGFVVCAKPLRFQKLSDDIAMSFVEVGGENCYYVFESKEDARQRLESIPLDDRLGSAFVIREVRYLPRFGPRNGPRLDATGHPFQMRGFIIDKSGAKIEWRHSGRLGWGEVATTAPNSGILGWILSWLRQS